MKDELTSDCLRKIWENSSDLMFWRQRVAGGSRSSSCKLEGGKTWIGVITEGTERKRRYPSGKGQCWAQGRRWQMSTEIKDGIFNE